MNEKITTDMQGLLRLLEDVDNGKVKLPDFQREYDWGPAKVKKIT